MLSFKKRSYKKELLDGIGVPFDAIKRNMQELDFINGKLGGHAIILQGIETVIKVAAISTDSLLVLEIGSGGGDNLRTIKLWAEGSKLRIKLLGVDANSECIAYAKEQQRNNGIEFIHSDYRMLSLPDKPAIIFSSLFCHHFTDEELILQLVWMQKNCTLGFFINDLHRHPVAYYSIKALTAVFSKSYLVRNDAPLSVQRGFKKKEWVALFHAAGIKNYNCRWRWAFRWLVTCLHADK